MKFLITSDIHFERLELDKLRNYIDYFKESIITYKPEILFFAGDTSDSSLLRTETFECEMLSIFLKEVTECCNENNVEFIILRGTASHDGEVISNLIKMMNLKVTYIDIMMTKLLCNKIVLFMPEKVYTKYEEFENEYKSFLRNGKPDLVIFHGMWDFGVPALKQIDSKFNNPRSIVMNSKKFLEDTNALTIGGHVHSFINYKKIYYTGRFINERGRKNNELSTYGIKYVELKDDNSYTITNVPNPYMIPTITVEFDISKISSAEELISKANDYDIENTLFYLYHDGTTLSKSIISQFLNVVKPKYVRKKSISNNEVVTSITKNETFNFEINHQSLGELIKETYKDIFKETIPERYVQNILYGEGGVMSNE